MPSLREMLAEQRKQEAAEAERLKKEQEASAAKAAVVPVVKHVYTPRAPAEAEIEVVLATGNKMGSEELRFFYKTITKQTCPRMSNVKTLRAVINALEHGTLAKGRRHH